MSAQPAARPISHPSRQAGHNPVRPASPTNAPYTGTTGHPSLRIGHCAASPATAHRTSSTANPNGRAGHIPASPAAAPGTGMPSHSSLHIGHYAASPATAHRTSSTARPNGRAGHIPSRPASPTAGPISHLSRTAEHNIVRSARHTVSAPRPARGTNINGNPKPKSAGRTLTGIFLHGLKTQ